MIEYNKIETLWKRDMDGTKKLLEGEFRNPTVEFLKDNIWQIRFAFLGVKKVTILSTLKAFLGVNA